MREWMRYAEGLDDKYQEIHTGEAEKRRSQL